MIMIIMTWHSNKCDTVEQSRCYEMFENSVEIVDFIGPVASEVEVREAVVSCRLFLSMMMTFILVVLMMMMLEVSKWWCWWWRRRWCWHHWSVHRWFGSKEICRIEGSFKWHSQTVWTKTTTLSKKQNFKDVKLRNKQINIKYI